jgi:hypothetical protein
MNSDVPRRFWLEVALATATGVALILFLVRRDWIEGVLPVDPDAHSGSLELLLIVLLSLASITCGVLARRDWVRGRPAAEQR